MARRSARNSQSDLDQLKDEWDFKEDVVAVEDAPAYNSISTVHLRCLLGVKSLTMDGPVTGNKYVWHGANPVEVDEQDAPALLAKKFGGRACCGGQLNQVFEIMK